MPPFRARTTTTLIRTLTTTPLRRSRPSRQLTPKCPPSTCICAPTPPLDIDKTSPIANTAAPYTQHILIPTGQHDWPSRIEDADPSQPWGTLTAYLKRELGPKGNAFDPLKPSLISTTSFRPGRSNITAAEADGSMMLFPSFRYFPSIEVSKPTALVAAASAIRGSGVDGEATTSHLTSVAINHPTILICSHGSRDSRCGELGPLLHREFVAQLSRLGLVASTSHISTEEDAGDVVNVGCISHIGGHKWAGNVIVYMPKGSGNALAGSGVWYGRVEPRHAEGIIHETVLGGRIIEELWRGGIEEDGSRMWMS